MIAYTVAHDQAGQVTSLEATLEDGTRIRIDGSRRVYVYPGAWWGSRGFRQPVGIIPEGETGALSIILPPKPTESGGK